MPTIELPRVKPTVEETIKSVLGTSHHLSADVLRALAAEGYAIIETGVARSA